MEEYMKRIEEIEKRIEAIEMRVKRLEEILDEIYLLLRTRA